MKANLARREPEFIEAWREGKLYERIIDKNRGKEKFVLHDGPPYANGRIHQGHILNKILKDFIVRYKNMAGYYSPYVPGWDCHGLPIEHKVAEEIRKKKEEIGRKELRRRCRNYADKFVKIQREEFERLGVMGAWERPYLTMSHEYEAAIAREFAGFVGAGLVYQGKKPVYWCWSCETALAEAEVEYDEHRSPSIYVKFPLKDDPAKVDPALAGREVFFVIWTTTPWTIPANLAVCLHPGFTYAAVTAEKTGEAVLVMARELAEGAAKEAGLGEVNILAEFPSTGLEGLKCSHPIYDRESIVILGDHVTLEAGTGCVHTAPGHGQEDYQVGLKYNLDVLNHVDDRGLFTEEAPGFEGLFVQKGGNKAVCERLHRDGMLLNPLGEELSHQFPHCWRCKKPVLFRATPQWFISMDRGDFRKRALAEIEKVEWIPRWGKERIHGMIENRPDWCISRQRAWGVPITVAFCEKCRTPLLSKRMSERAAEFFEKEGADAWFDRPLEDFLPEGSKCEACGRDRFERGEDILDVWFDSGVSWAGVLERDPDLGFPCDLYLEGSDQHRGWFHSSLLAGVGTRGRAPYRQVLTHGFVVDAAGKKYSKSAPTYVPPEKIINQRGAEVLRLWVCAEDYRYDITIGEEILKRLTETYRKIRNSLRYCLGNLAGFDPASHVTPPESMQPLDRWILHRLQELTGRCRAAFENYDFHQVYHGVNEFCTVDFSALYCDAVKDRLYCDAPEGPGRRSARSVLYEVARTLCRLLAPIACFTADEAWSHLPGEKEDSVHLADYPSVREEFLDRELAERWEKLLSLRQVAAKALEEARREGKIGAPLDAHATLAAGGETARFIEENRRELKNMLIVSKLTVRRDDDLSGADVRAEVEKAPGAKCERCWCYSEAVGQSADHPGLCERCREVVNALDV